MQLLMTLFVAALFFVLTPGILLSLPPNGSKVTVAITHALVFAVIYGLIHKLVYAYLYEGFLFGAKKPGHVAAPSKNAAIYKPVKR